jgi:hypothetical protein
VNPTPDGVGRFLVPFVLAVLIVVLVAGVAVGASLWGDAPARDAAIVAVRVTGG